MKKIICLIICFCFLSIHCPANAKSVNLNTGLIIPIVFSQPINSSNVKNGNMLPVVIAQDVMVEGKVIFKKGTTGAVFVDNAKPARSFGRGGILEFQTGKLPDILGNEHDVNLTSTVNKGESSKLGMILPIVSVVILWPLAFFAFKKGEDAVIPAGKTFSTFITSPSTVNIK